MKTIGTSPKQLRKLLQKQANLLNVLGIPVGLGLGYFLGLILLPNVMKITSYQDVGEMHPKLWVFVAAVFSFVTVWISCRRPAKMMSKMSPMQALRYQGREGSNRKKARGRESRARILQMAISNTVDNKAKTFLVVLSLSLSIILLNSILNLAGSFDQETYVEGLSAADFVVSNISFETREESQEIVVPQEFLEEVELRTDIEKNGAVYFYQAPDDITENLGNQYEGIETVKVLDINQEPYSEELAERHGKMHCSFFRLRSI